MGRVAQISASNAMTFTDNTTRYVPLNGFVYNGISTEAQAQLPFNTTGGTFDQGGVYVSQNGVSSNSTIRLRQNATTNINPNISVTGSTTGLFEDTTNSSSISATDKINWSIVVPSVAGTQTITLRILFCRFSASSNTYQRLSSLTFGSSNTYGSTTRSFLGLGEGLDTTNTANEIYVQHKFYTGGTLQKGMIFLSANTRDSTTTLNSRIGAADGNIAVSITASTTGLFEDTSNTDTVTSGNLVNMAIVGTAGAGSMTITIYGMEFTTTNKKSHVYSAAPSTTAFSTGTTYWLPLSGVIYLSSSNEAFHQYKARFASTITNLQTYVTANLATTADTLTIRKNANNGNNSVSITALTTGLFEDTMNSDSIAIDDLVNYQLVIGLTAGTSITMFGCMIEDTTADAGSTYISNLALLGVG